MNLCKRLVLLLALPAVCACQGIGKGDGGDPDKPQEKVEKTIAFSAPAGNLQDVGKVMVSLNEGAPVEADMRENAGQVYFSARFTEDENSVKSVFHAIAPASAYSGGNSSSFTVEIPSDFASTTLPAGVLGAKSSSYYGLPDYVELNFNQLCAFVRLKITGLPEGESPSSVEFSSSRELAGKWAWSPESGLLSPVEAVKSVIIRGGDPVFCCAPASLGGTEVKVGVTTASGTIARNFSLGTEANLNPGVTAMLAFDFTPDPDPQTGLWLVKNGAVQHSIAYAGDFASSATSFAADFKKLTGSDISAEALPGQEGNRILIGRKQDGEEFASALSETAFGYAVALSGSDIVIAGTDDCSTILAMEAFIAEAGKFANGNNLLLPEDFGIKETEENPQMFARFLQEGRNFSIGAEQVLYCAGADNMIVAQGAASDGEHVYFVMRDRNDTQAIVFKYSLDDFKEVARTAVFQGYHCNDMTFDLAGKRALVVHGSGDSQKLTAVNASTMALSTVNAGTGIGGMAYNAPLNRYGITQGGSKFIITNSAFTQLRDFGPRDRKAEGSEDYTPQGMGADDTFVYFPMSGDYDNILVAYSWEGKYAATLHVPVRIESESMFHAAGNYYMMCDGDSHRAYLYRLYPVIEYSPMQ